MIMYKTKKRLQERCNSTRYNQFDIATIGSMQHVSLYLRSVLGINKNPGRCSQGSIKIPNSIWKRHAKILAAFLWSPYKWLNKYVEKVRYCRKKPHYE